MISKRIPNFFALGFGLEWLTYADENFYWPALQVKVFLGCWVGNWCFRIGWRRRH